MRCFGRFLGTWMVAISTFAGFAQLAAQDTADEVEDLVRELREPQAPSERAQAATLGDFLINSGRVQPQELLERIRRDQPTTNYDCEIPEGLKAVESKSADRESMQAVAEDDFRYLAFERPTGLTVPGIVYASRLCSEISNNLRPALPDGEGVGYCPERVVLWRIALDFAGEYNALMKEQRKSRGIDPCVEL